MHLDICHLTQPCMCDMESDQFGHLVKLHGITKSLSRDVSRVFFVYLHITAITNEPHRSEIRVLSKGKSKPGKYFTESNFDFFLSIFVHFQRNLLHHDATQKCDINGNWSRRGNCDSHCGRTSGNRVSWVWIGGRRSRIVCSGMASRTRRSHKSWLDVCFVTKYWSHRSYFVNDNHCRHCRCSGSRFYRRCSTLKKIVHDSE